ncbi:MAG: T9SS type A sorting domain-containing protein [Candidatus Cloacimonetes bacterium]|nr:T9SS type A sorting domain-containing protein [Candidatus Cloacimonadota bacterium]
MKKIVFSLILLLSLVGLSAQFLYIDFQDNSGTFLGPSGEDPQGWDMEVYVDNGESDYIPTNNENCQQTVENYGMPGYLWSNYLIIQTGTVEPTAEAHDIYLKVYNADHSCFTVSGLYTVTTDAWQTAEFGGTWSAWDCGGTPPTPIDWLDGITGSIEGGTPSVPGSGYGTGLPNEDLLGIPANVGYYFTLTIDDGVTVDVTLCIDQIALGYVPVNLAYFDNGIWTYVEPLAWTDPMTANACITFNIDPTSKGSRAPVDIPIVMANVDGPLPVELSQFTVAQTQGEYVTIGWTTQSETDMSGYKVYRSNDNDQNNMVVISELIQAENLAQSNDYQYNDSDVEVNSTYYYWLQAIALDGNTEFFGFDPITIDEEFVTPPVEITELNSNYPNPFNPDTKIKFSIKEGETGILSIYNAKGQLVESNTFGSDNHIYEWDGTKYGSGIYFYKLKTDSYSQVKKMMMLK